MRYEKIVVSKRVDANPVANRGGRKTVAITSGSKVVAEFVTAVAVVTFGCKRKSGCKMVKMGQYSLAFAHRIFGCKTVATHQHRFFYDRRAVASPFIW